MRIRLSVLTVAALLALLGGCARQVETQVTRFHEGRLPAGETFTVQPQNPEKHGPEFQQYANMIVREFSAYGYKRSDSGNPDLLVTIDYGVSQGRTQIDSRPGFGYPYYSYHVGFAHHPHSFAYFHPFHYSGYLGPDVYSRTVYTRKLKMKITDAGEDQVVFEGRAISEGPKQEISLIMPYLVESMFRDFPGDAGTTKVVEIETKDGKRY